MADDTTPAPAKHAWFVDSGGKVTPVGLDKAAEAQQNGWVPASSKQIDDYQLQEKYGGLGQQLKTGAEAAGDALTLGLSTVGERAAGVPAQDIQGREEANPVSHGVGTAVGIAAPLVLSGGAAAPEAGAELAGEAAPAVAGALGSGVKSAASLTAPSLISGLGESAGAAADAFLPEASTFLGQTARSAAVGAAKAATEGAVYGAGNVVHEAALGDPNLTAQSALSEIGLSAALGGGLGGLTGIGEEVIPALARKTKDVVSGAFNRAKQGIAGAYGAAEGVTGVSVNTAAYMVENAQAIDGLNHSVPGIRDSMAQATPQMAEWAVKNGSRLAEMEARFPGTAQKLMMTGPEAADELLGNWQKIITDPAERIKVATNLRTGLQDVMDSTQKLGRELNTKIIPGEEEALLGAGAGGANPEAVAQAHADLGGKIDQAVQEMRAEPELHSGTMARQLEKIRDGLAREADAAEAEGPLGVRDAYRRLKTLRQQLDEHTSFGQEAMLLGRSEKNSNNIFKSLRSDVSSALKNEEIFGQQAARKAALDEAQSDMFRLTGKKGIFKKAFLDSDGKVTSSRVDTWINSLAKDKGVESAEAMGKFMDAAKRLADEAEKSNAVAGVSSFDRDALRSLQDKTSQMIQDTRLSGKATATMKNLSNGGTGIPNSGAYIHESGAKTLAKMIPGVHTATEIWNTAKSVPKATAVLAALERAGQKASRAIDAGVGAILKGATSSVVRGMEAKAAADYFDKHTENIGRLAGNPAALEEALTKQAGHLEHAPQTAAAMQMTSAQAVSFLASKIPPMPKLGLVGPKLKPSKQDMWKFNRYHAALEAPTRILHLAAAGKITPEDVEAVKTIYPAHYGEMTAALVKGMASHKGTIPYASRLGISMMLGQDVDGSTAQATIAANQMAYALPSSKSGEDATGPGALGKSTQTGLGKLTLASRNQLPGQATARRNTGEA